MLMVGDKKRKTRGIEEGERGREEKRREMREGQSCNNRDNGWKDRERQD